MATLSASLSIPQLAPGDHLSRDEFELRYNAMPNTKKAELIEGIVYMGSPVTVAEHGSPHADLIAWLGIYRSATPGVQVADNATLRLDNQNEPQPDALLRVLPNLGGQSRDDGLCVAGAPELVAEITASSVSYDLFEKKDVYARHGVQEYVVWRVRDREVDWFCLRDGAYYRVTPDPDGVYRSEVFPGLWLDPAALLAGDMLRVIDTLRQGIDSPGHAAFVGGLNA